jgi:Glycosyl hydrolases family 15
VESFGLSGPVDDWRELRAAIHRDICQKGFDRVKNSFVQYYGGEGVDAALLLIPQVGFLAPEDPRVHGTVAAIERELMIDDLVLRYRTEENVDGLPPGEGAFLACTFWLADAYAMLGRYDDAEGLFEHLLSYRNDLGLLAGVEGAIRAARQAGKGQLAVARDLHVGVSTTGASPRRWSWCKGQLAVARDLHVGVSTTGASPRRWSWSMMPIWTCTRRSPGSGSPWQAFG